MKRGKEEDKVMGPMFPRLHVTDTEKGGPRAPPRNKMALYEQLTIPSHRYNPGGSMSQVANKDNYFVQHQPLSASPLSADKLSLPHSGHVNHNTQVAGYERRKKFVDEDDFTVPIFSQSGMGLYNGTALNPSYVNGDKHVLPNSSQMTRPQSHLSNEPSQVVSPMVATGRGDVSYDDREDSRGSGMGKKSTGQVDGRLSDLNNQPCRDEVNMHGDDNGSQTSRVDSVSDSGVSPDDVVRLIGLNHFWKARRAIVNQQRVFAVQVFELHRLIKVQKLIAESPDLLLECSTLVSKSPLKGASVKKPAARSAVKAIAQVTKKIEDSRKLNQKIEHTAENAVGELPVSSLQNPSQHITEGPFSASTVPANDMRMVPWFFPQPTSQQWLVPVMSPSEGLVYKPYPGPAFSDRQFGGLMPFCPSPMGGNFFGPTGMPFPGPVYFPPYGMPMISPVVSGSSVDQINHVSGSTPTAPMALQQTSCNMPTNKDGALSSGVRMPPSKGSEWLGSSASSPVEKTQSVDVPPLPEGGDGQAVFPIATCSQASGVSSRQCEPDQPSKVIRVVPRNPRTATESATRILRSIQEERKQHQSN